MIVPHIIHHFQRIKQSKQLADIVTKGIQEKKGQNIVTADLSNIKGTIANYFVTYQGNSPTQVGAVPESIGDTVREDLKEEPVNVIGPGADQWVTTDFTGILVHVFLPETKVSYDLENLWEDAKLARTPDQG